ncbi:complement C1q tumor necrosis factor-related protein 3-like [Magallana gigas]|uniref:complement C1q tumor necrosis factor-related protein 3-like n=1 Tax=Magallana gigas TaxID=29159 RepID=UPI003340B5B1
MLQGVILACLVACIILQEKRFEELESEHSHLWNKVEDLTQNGSLNKVAFTAGTSGAGNIGTGSTIVFPVVINNEGGGYNPDTGVFTAPRSGQYVFFVSAQGYGSDTLYVSIVHNGGAKVMTMSDGGRGKDFYDSGTNLAALNLQQGDTVWAKCHSGSSFYSEGIPITTFSGFLI